MPLTAGQPILATPRTTLVRELEGLRSRTIHARLATGVRLTDTTSAFGNDLAAIEQVTKQQFFQYERKEVDGYAPALMTFLAAYYDSGLDYARLPRALAAFTPSADWTTGFDCVALVEGGSSVATRDITEINTATDTFTTAAAHGLTNQDDVMIGGDVVPAGSSASTLYKAINVTSTTFQISTDGTNAVNVTSAGTNPFLRYAKGELLRPVWIGAAIIPGYGGAPIQIPVDLNLGSVNTITRMLE